MVQGEWRPVLGLETHYAVSACGAVMSTATKTGRPRARLLRPYGNGNGYRAIDTQISNRKVKVFVHRAVWEAFHGAIPGGLEINHKNGVRDDNRLENLELVTRSENMLHGLRTLGRVDNQPRGSRHGCAKLTESDIPVIRELLTTGLTSRQIASRYEVTKSAIKAIAQRTSWRHV